MLQVVAATILLLQMGTATPPADKPTVVGDGPEPAPVPVSWEIDFKYVQPRRIEVLPPGAEQPVTYWYILYTATNTSENTQYFFPTFELVTDDLKVIPTDTGISPLVFDAIRERHKVTHKYLVHPTKAIGKLRVGDDYARESVAIWRADDITTVGFTVYVAGLSGEARAIRNPAYDPDQPETKTITGDSGREHEVTINPKYFTLRKTLRLRYTFPAANDAHSRVSPRLDGADWIMR